MPVLDVDGLIVNRVEATRSFVRAAGCTRVAVDVSGGVDSAVILMIAARAMGPDNCTAVFQGISSSPDAHSRAREVCEAAGVRFVDFDGTDLFNTYVQNMTAALVKAGFSDVELADRIQADPTILGSIRSTLRAPWGRGANRLTGGGIRLGTGNEDEDRVLRFYQKGGDGEVDCNPIAMLSKGETFQIAIALGVPQSILNARPSPDLWGVGEAHNDEDEIGAYLHIKDCGFPFYSYVDGEGRYKNVGLIERLHRYIDNGPYSEAFFQPRDHGEFNPVLLDNIVEDALNETDEFKGVPENVVRQLFISAQRIEHITRHKMNPNCPSLGSRQDLLDDELITNDLPV